MTNNQATEMVETLQAELERARERERDLRDTLEIVARDSNRAEPGKGEDRGRE